MSHKTTKEIDSSEYIFAIVIGNDDSNLDKDKMTMLTQYLERRNRHPSFRCIEKGNLSPKGLKSINVTDNSNNEYEKPNKR